MVNWKDLAAYPAFRALYTDPNDNPVTQRIHMIRVKIASVDITDPVETMRWKAELAGLEFVKNVVESKSGVKILQLDPSLSLAPPPISVPPSSSTPTRLDVLTRQIGGRPCT